MNLSTSHETAATSATRARSTPNTPWWIPTVAAIACALLTSLWLHSLQARSQAGLIPLILLPWGLLALAALRTSRPPLWGIALAAIATRFVFVGGPPLLSDDLFRYLAEGHALNHGENPFVTAPAQLQSISETLREQVNHGQMTSIYPPIALLWFRVVDALSGAVGGAQLLTGMLDLLIVGAIATLTGRRWALVYALHPLGPIEAALSAHIDVLAVALLAWAAVWARTRPHVSGALIALAGGAKLLPFSLLPAALRSRSPRAIALGFALGMAVIALASGPIVSSGASALSSLQAYGAHWSFNGLGLALVSPVFGSLTRPVLALIGLAAFVWATWRHRTLQGTWLIIGATFLCVTPTAHPWYLLWVAVPGLLCKRWEWMAASTFLMGSYAVLLTVDSPSGWTEQTWLLPATWGPAIVVVSLATWRRWRLRPEPPP